MTDIIFIVYNIIIRFVLVSDKIYLKQFAIFVQLFKAIDSYTMYSSKYIKDNYHKCSSSLLPSDTVPKRLSG